jgi:hypothetical protein
MPDESYPVKCTAFIRDPVKIIYTVQPEQLLNSLSTHFI